jgi:hydroxylamine dehydrogenase
MPPGQTTPGVFADWAKSRHANANITCLDCHLVQPGDQDIAQDHEKYYSRPTCPGARPSTKCPSPPS